MRQEQNQTKRKQNKKTKFYHTSKLKQLIDTYILCSGENSLAVYQSTLDRHHLRENVTYSKSLEL